MRPAIWARRSDPITGRLFYVNLVTNRLYAKIPSSVTAAMLNLGHEAVANKRAAVETLNRKKATSCQLNVPAKYKPLQVLREGSYGFVCAETDTDTKKNIAIKKITPMVDDEWDAKHT
ncbi:hypothetical protein GN958_ATG20042 [Phytophthora infestans]|uniref:Protein kinase n=1 Tax=Phytophthora infestans TaxID=4787 RepID=A0A8S9TXZ0_PHYIN|nr:hypothetical protein GN958_ATG20042 [Phytophthora infestans]